MPALSLLWCTCYALSSGGHSQLPAGGTVFLQKFCFSFHPSGRDVGDVGLHVQAPNASSLHNVSFLLLDDQDESYTGPSSEWSALSCQARRERARASKQIDWRELAAGTTISYTVNQKLRPRWWYVAVTNCDDAAELSVDWTVDLTNWEYGWAKQFSTDRRYSLHAFTLLALLYAILAAAQSVAGVHCVAAAGAGDSKGGKAAHPFARLLFAGLLLALSECVMSVVHCLRFAWDGEGTPILFAMAQLSSVCSGFVLASLLLLVSEGKCVSYVMVTADVRRVLRLLGPFLLSCLVLELWGEYALSRNYTTDYVYTTPCGWALVAVDLCLLGLYLRNLRQTYLAECDGADGRFYRTWGLLYALWFLALPITVALAQMVLAPYVWFIVSLGTKKGATVLAYASLVVGLWPGNMRTHFKQLHEVAVTTWFAGQKGLGAGGPTPYRQQQAPDPSSPRLLSGTPAGVVTAPFKDPPPTPGRLAKLAMSP